MVPFLAPEDPTVPFLAPEITEPIEAPEFVYPRLAPPPPPPAPPATPPPILAPPWSEEGSGTIASGQLVVIEGKGKGRTEPARAQPTPALEPNP